MHIGGLSLLATEIYLRLPSMLRRSKKTTFSYIKDNICKSMNTWKGEQRGDD
jgi:hypothetical protein